jgi:quercetin dioxygenase-like cupin family protein
MAIHKYDNITMTPVVMEGANKVTMEKVVGPDQGWKSHTLRVFKIEPGGCTPRHAHNWEHVNYVISGKGRLRLGDDVTDVSEKDFAFVPPNTEHQFDNPYDAPFEFICIIPNDIEYR